jgi:Tol biopolymer transport system component
VTSLDSRASRARRNALCGCLIAVAGTLAAAGPAGAAALTERVSVATGGGQASDFSRDGAVSMDGRHVAFQSPASDLVAGDSNGAVDVFVRDRQAGVTERVSVAGDSAQANSHSLNAAISADGRYVAFLSFASNLVAGDTNEFGDVFVHDRQSGGTERVSVASDGTQANFDSGRVAVSADGRYVAFESFAWNLVAGDTINGQDIYVHDRQTGVTERVSAATDGTEPNGPSFRPAISADGSSVAFSSEASDLVAGDSNGASDVFVRDRQTGATDRVSVATGGAQAAHASQDAAISADGGQVAFLSAASNLVPGDTNDAVDVFVRDRQTGVTERVSVATDGTQANSFSQVAAISAEGRHVAFTSFASNLVAGDTNGWGDIFVRDRQTGVTERVSIATDGTQANNFSQQAAISADGRHVAFHSRASNLVAGDTNGLLDMFVRDRAVTACSDGTDNDGDGQVDYPNDPGCSSPADNNETNPRCNDGVDNDGDGQIDYPGDPGCTSRTDNNEANARCNDGLDNDNDGFTDYPNDVGCSSLTDNNETNPQCSDGSDNDGDGQIDYPQDSGCSSATDNRENTAPRVTLVTDPGPGEPFQFGDTIAFDVTVTDDAPVDCSRVVVTYVLRHDQHGHAGQSETGCTGTLTTDAGDSQHGANLSALIVARYTDTGGLAATDEVDIPPNP